MIERRVCGDVPAKHHIVHKDSSGKLLHEHCFTRDGFDGPYTILYHQHRPHLAEAKGISKRGWNKQAAEDQDDQDLRRRHYKTPQIDAAGTPIDARIPLLFNADVTLSVLKPTASDDVYFSNSDGDDLYYIHSGGGVLHTLLGDVTFSEQDYVYVPKGLLHRFSVSKENQYWLSIECHGRVKIPSQWRNDAGQLRMDAPYCHRDFRGPVFQNPSSDVLRKAVIRRGGKFYDFTYPHNPFDVVGWDGTVYPFAFAITDFQPRVGLTHLPPTWHGTFASPGALICSFVPRLVDFHPQSIPCPYPHSSVDCDEFIFYCKGNFTSRKGVGPGSVSFHPAGIPHGPHSGAYETSIGTKKTDELAVMLDTYQPLLPTKAALGIEDHSYHHSFS